MTPLSFIIDLAMPVVFLLLPLVMTTLVPRNREVAIDDALLRRLMGFLWLATLGGLASFAAVRLLGSAEAARHLGLVSLAFLPLSIRIMSVKNPDWGSPDKYLRKRSAMLTPRTTETLVPRGVWIFGWGIWAACVVAALLRWREPFTPEEWTRWQWTTATLVVMGPFHLLLGSYCIARLPQEAEPLPSNPPVDLLAAYADLRKSRARGLAALTLLMLAAIGIPLAVQSWTAPGPWWGVVGGVGGSAIGIWGGVFGASASFRRARINAVVRRLGQQAAGGAPA